MSTVLDKIVASKRQEIAQRREHSSEAELAGRIDRAEPPRDFYTPLAPGHGMRLIAEVKRQSPSAGTLRREVDPVSIASTYAAHGAAAVSVLTDLPFFGGTLEDLTAVRDAVAIPVLRKDFILDRYQLLEARLAGADAVLLIAEILPGDELARLLTETHALGMHALVELYDPVHLPRVLDSGARVIGINNRDLRSFDTDLEHTIRLATRIPRDRILVSESGIRSRADVVRLEAAGVHAMLVGETLMKSPEIGRTICELLGKPA